MPTWFTALTADSSLLTATWLIPTFTIFALLFMKAENKGAIRRLSLVSAVTNLALVIFLTIKFSHQNTAVEAGSRLSKLLFSQDVVWFPALNIHYFIGVDGISMLMMLLASIIVFTGVLASWKMEDRIKEYFIFMFVLVAGTFGCFISFDLFTFFLFNEITLIPTYLLIGVFGSGKKEYAAMKLNLMLIGGSALILTGILGLYFAGGHTFNMVQLASTRLPDSLQYWAFPALFLGFGVLGALFPFHTWSPDGHSSAPTAISMFLAGVHMKLGGYGCLRAALYLMPEGARWWGDIFLVLATINVAYGALVAIKHTDLKYINAYSSVSHCGLVLFGFLALNFIGIKGAILQMLSHGFLTAAFFLFIGMVYSRTHTRLVPEMGGLMKSIPFIGVGFVIVGFAGLGLPGLSGFVAEVTIFIGAFQRMELLNRICTIISVLSIVTTAVYILRATNSVFHGPLKIAPHQDKVLLDASWSERVAGLTLIGCIVAMGIYPGWITRIVDTAVEPIINNLAR